MRESRRVQLRSHVPVKGLLPLGEIVFLLHSFIHSRHFSNLISSHDACWYRVIACLQLRSHCWCSCSKHLLSVFQKSFVILAGCTLTKLAVSRQLCIPVLLHDPSVEFIQNFGIDSYDLRILVMPDCWRAPCPHREKRKFFDLYRSDL